MNLFNGAESSPSRTVSLSSSASPASQAPSVSVSVPSLVTSSVPEAQSSQVSPSTSLQTTLFSGVGIVPIQDGVVVVVGVA